MARVASAFFLEFVPPRYLSVAQVKGRLLRALQLQGEAMKKDMYATTATWKNHHPRFDYVVRYAGGASYVFAWTSDKTWRWLNSGTRVRYATMDQDFAAKTRHHYFGSYPGQGGLAYVSKRVVRPGIEARDWTFALKMKYKRPFRDAVYNATVKSLALTKSPP